MTPAIAAAALLVLLAPASGLAAAQAQAETGQAAPRAASRVSGVVTDARGTPLAGATVRLAGRDGAPAATAVSGEDGAFEAAVPPGRYTVTLERAGSCRLTHGAVVLGPGEAVSLRPSLQPCVAVTGIAQTPQGEPLAGARVRIDLARQRPAALRRGSENEGDLKDGATAVESGADGAFRIAELPRADGYVLEVRHKDHPPLDRRLDLAAADATARLTLRFVAAAEIRATFVGPDDKPVPDVEIRAVRVDTPAGKDAAPAAASGAEGIARVRPLAPGRYRLEAHPPSGLTQYHGPFTLAAGQVADVGRVLVRPGAAIAGRVVDAGRRPVAKAKVTALRRLGGASKKERTATTAADGTFRLTGLAEARYALRVAPGDDAFLDEQREAVDAPARDVEIALRRAATLTGTARARGGRCSLERLRVRALEIEADGGAREVGTPKIVDAERGAFEIARLPAGEIVVSAVASGCLTARSEPVRVREGQAAGPVEVTLQAGALLQGRVVDAATDSGVAGAAVRLEDGADETVATDEGGHFELTGARAGQNFVRVAHPDYAPARVAAALDLDDPRPLTVPLSAGATLEGSVTQASGAPVPGSRIEVEREGSGGRAAATAVTGDDGGYRFEHLPPGAALVRRFGGGDLFDEAEQKPVELEDGGSARVDFVLGGVVEGRVTRGGLPVAGVRVTLAFAEEPKDGPPGGVARSAWTDPEGAFRMEGVAAGVNTLTIAADGQRTLRRVRIPQADTYRLDVALGNRLLTGTVVEGRGGKPVPGAALQASAGKDDAGADWTMTTSQEDDEGQYFLLVLGGSASEHAASGADGSIRLFVDEGPAYSLWAWAEAGTATVEVPPGATEPLRVELRRLATLRVRLRGPGGAELAGARICSRVRSGSHFASSCNWTGPDAVQPEFTFQWDAGQAAEVLAVAPGFAVKVAEVPELRADGEGEPNTLALELERAGVLRIPLGPGMEVRSIVGPAGTDLREPLQLLQQIVALREFGTIVARIEGLPPGEYRIGLGPPEGEPSSFVTAVVQPGATIDAK